MSMPKAHFLIIPWITFLISRGSFYPRLLGLGLALSAALVVAAPVGAQLIPDTSLHTLIAEKDVKIDADSRVMGAGKNIKLEEDSRLDGRAFAHDKVEIKKNVHVVGSPTDPPPELQKPFILLDPTSDVYRLFVGLAGDEIKIDKDSVVTGDIHSNDKIDVKKDALVDGNASAVGEIKGDGEITGSSNDNAAPQVLPYWPSVSSLQGLADRVFEDDITFSDEIVDDVVFVFGKVEIEGSLRGGGTIIAMDEIRFKGAPGPADPAARLSLISYDDIKLDKDWTFRGSLRAGKDIKLEQRNGVLGIAIADHKLDIKKEAQLTLEWVASADVTPPRFTVTSPGETPVPGLRTPEIELEYSDDDSGVRLSSLEVKLDGVPLAGCVVDPEVASCTPPPLAEGPHRVEASLSDLAGNRTTAALDFLVLLVESDTEPPELIFRSPVVGPVVEGLVPDLRLELFDALSGVDGASLELTRNGVDVLAFCVIGPTSVVCPMSGLDLGSHLLAATVADVVGNVATATVAFEVVAESGPPALEILTPTVAVVVGESAPEVRVSYSDTGSGVDPSTLRAVLDGSTLSCSTTPSEAICTSPTLEPGGHGLSVEVADLRGNLSRRVLNFSIDLRLDLAITSPSSGILTRRPSIDVAGTVSREAETVEVAGLSVPVVAGTFEIPDVPLAEGGNTLAVVARSAGGGLGMAVLQVARDSEPPRPVVRTPVEGFVSTEATVTVAGEVVDPALSSLVASPMSIEVAGQPATLQGRTFLAEGVLLAPGENRLTVEAIDGAGNVGASVVTMFFQPAVGSRIEKVLGDGQRAAAGTSLAQPLVVRLVDTAGAPLAGRPVTFTVRRGDGQVNDGIDGGRRLSVTSDEHGLAQAHFTLGGRAGVGNHEVVATATGLAGAAVFCASAEAGSPRQIVRIVGDDQTGGTRRWAAGEIYPKPLLSQVFDDFGNPLAGVTVAFETITGGGSFDGQPSTEVLTDARGIAAAVYTLGAEVGIANQVVTASFAGVEAAGATYTFSAVEPGNPSQTSLSGLVLDNQNQPVPGARVWIVDTSHLTTTDAEGRFQLAGAPVGVVHLVIDGTTSPRPGPWPRLAFDLPMISGRDNSVGMPIRLPILDLAGQRTVGGSQDVTVPLANVPGASLTVMADSVTFPDGTEEGGLTFSQVHADKVPMVAPMGSNFALAFTIQPPGVHFDPPARVQIPNLGMPPGATVDIFSFDHDMGEFVTAGSASVSDDGLYLRSDLGFGISKSGWGGCVTPPADPADVCQGGRCTVCQPGSKRPVPLCTGCQKCSADKAGQCEDKDPGSLEIAGNLRITEVVTRKDRAVLFAGMVEGNNCQLAGYEWFLDGTKIGEGNPFEHTFSEIGEKTIRAEVKCKDCDSNVASDTLPVIVTTIDRIEVEDGAVELSVNDEEAGAAGACREGGDVMLRAVLDPPVEEDRLQQDDFVTWSGGRDGGGQLRRRVSKASFVKEVVEARVGDDAYEMRVYVVGAEPTGYSPENGQSGDHFPDNSNGFPGASTGLAGPGPQGGNFASFVEIEFTVQPPELVSDVMAGDLSESEIQFDVSREARIRFWLKKNGLWSEIFYPEKGSALAWTSDDSNSGDEDNNPFDGNGHIYGTDTPGWGGSAEGYVIKFNMREFVRVGFGGQSGEGQPRCSDYSFWRSFRSVERSGPDNAMGPSVYGNEIPPNNLFWGAVPLPGIDIITTALPAGQRGEPYNQSLAAMGGQPPISWSLDSGTLPAGLSLTPGGSVVGTPGESGSFSFGVEAQDSSNNIDLQDITLIIQ